MPLPMSDPVHKLQSSERVNTRRVSDLEPGANMGKSPPSDPHISEGHKCHPMDLLHPTEGGYRT